MGQQRCVRCPIAGCATLWIGMISITVAVGTITLEVNTVYKIRASTVIYCVAHN